jgi:hypothetical protein
MKVTKNAGANFFIRLILDLKNAGANFFIRLILDLEEKFSSDIQVMWESKLHESSLLVDSNVYYVRDVLIGGHVRH